MALFHRKLKPLEIELTELPFDIYARGRSKMTTESAVFMDSQVVSDRFTRLAPNIKNLIYPKNTVTVSFRTSTDGQFRYYLGVCTKDFSQEVKEAEDVFIPKSTLCAKITVESGNVTFWSKRLGEARKLFYQTWLPKNGYTQHSEIESIELYGPEANFEVHSMNLYFPLSSK